MFIDFIEMAGIIGLNLKRSAVTSLITLFISLAKKIEKFHPYYSGY